MCMEACRTQTAGSVYARGGIPSLECACADCAHVLPAGDNMCKEYVVSRLPEITLFQP